MESFDNVMDRFCKSVCEQEDISKIEVQPTYSELTLSKIIKEQPGSLSTNELIQRRQFLEQQIDNLKKDVIAAEEYSDVAKSNLVTESQSLGQGLKTPLEYSKYPQDEMELLIELLSRYEPEKLAAISRQAKLRKSDVQFLREDDDIAQKISIFTNNPEETAETYSFLDATTEKTQLKMTIEEAQQKQLAADNFSLKKRLATYRCYYRESIDEMKRLKERIDLTAQKSQIYDDATCKIEEKLEKVEQIVEGYKE